MQFSYESYKRDNKMNLLIAGDFYVSEKYSADKLFDPSIISLFTEADYRIVNLEAPITTKKRQNEILKTGPHLHMDPEVGSLALKKLKVNLVSLANNHIMDYGKAGLLDTLAHLRRDNIDHVGAGLDLQEAAKPFIVEKDGFRIAVLNFAENEWATAKIGQPGANPLDVIENIKQLKELRKTNSFVILIIHGGYEHFHLPSPPMVKLYRFLADCGASLIVGHHSHCISGYEIYKDTPIFYGLGNLLFTQPSQIESWYTGLILSLRFQRNGELSWECIPSGQAKHDHFLALLEGKRRETIRNEVRKYSEMIADETLLNREWNNLLSERKRGYLNIFNPMNLIPIRPIRNSLIKLGLDRLFIRRKHYAQILNHLRCEAHFEASKNIIERFLE